MASNQGTHSDEGKVFLGARVTVVVVVVALLSLPRIWSGSSEVKSSQVKSSLTSTRGKVWKQCVCAAVPCTQSRGYLMCVWLEVRVCFVVGWLAGWLHGGVFFQGLILGFRGLVERMR